MAQANPVGDAAEAVNPVDAAQSDEAAGATTTARKRSFGRPALLAFIAISVALVVMTWVDNLTVKTDTTPAYYHGAFIMDPGHYATVTAEAIQFELTLAVTPEPTSTPGPAFTPESASTPVP